MVQESFIDLFEPHCAPGLVGGKVRHIAKLCVKKTVAFSTTRKIAPIDLVGHPAEEFHGEKRESTKQLKYRR